MRLALVEGAEAFCVHNKDIYVLSVRSLALHRRTPEPKALSAGINSRTHAEAIGSVKKHAVQQVAFTRSIHTCYCTNSNWTFQLGNQLFRLGVDMKFFKVNDYFAYIYLFSRKL